MGLFALKLYILHALLNSDSTTIPYQNDTKYFVITNFDSQNTSNIISFLFVIFEKYKISNYIDEYTKNLNKGQKKSYEIMYEVFKLISEKLHDQMQNSVWSKEFFVFFDHQTIILKYFETKHSLLRNPQHNSLLFCDDIILYNLMVKDFYWSGSCFNPKTIGNLYSFMYMLDFAAILTYSKDYELNYKKIEKYFKRFIIEKMFEMNLISDNSKIHCNQILLYEKEECNSNQRKYMYQILDSATSIKKFSCIYYVDPIYTINAFNKNINFKKQNLELGNLLNLYRVLQSIKINKEKMSTYKIHTEPYYDILTYQFAKINKHSMDKLISQKNESETTAETAKCVIV